MTRTASMAAGVAPARRWLTLLLVLTAAVAASLVLPAMLTSPADAAPPEGKGGDASLADRLAALEEKVAALETANAAQDTKISDLETANAAQDTKISDLETANAAQDTKIGELEADALENAQRWREQVQANRTFVQANLQQSAKISLLEEVNAAQDTKISELEAAALESAQRWQQQWQSNFAFNAVNVQQSTKITALETLLAGVTRSGTTLTFSGMNLQVVNGGGTTESSNGLGNLILGYNKAPQFFTIDRTGSHYLIVGDEHNYTSYGGIVAGVANRATAPWASASGRFNQATGLYASVSGGNGNVASGSFSSISGGRGNAALGYSSSILGGMDIVVDDPQDGIYPQQYVAVP